MTDIVMQGRILAQKYELVRLIGQGGMGAVYEARNQIGKRYAVKLLVKPEFAQDPQLATRFFREAKASAAIESEHVVQVYDTGVDQETGFPFIIMELLRGEDLEHTVERTGALHPLAATRIIGQAAVGLGRAHAAGIIHRDIKPANIFMSARDGGDAVVKILDFGIAKHTMDQLSSSEGAGLTKTGSMLGTPLYMSPEQAQGAKIIDQRTDIWSLAMCLYEALSGHTPWGDVDTLGGLILAICSKDVMPLQDLAPWVPPELAQVVHRGLSRQLDQRIQNCQQFVELLRPFTGGSLGITPDILVGVEEAQRRTTAPRAEIGGSSVSAVTASHPSLHQPPPAKKSNAGIFAFLALFLVVAGGGSWFAYTKLLHRDTPANDTPAAASAKEPATTASGEPSDVPSSTKKKEPEAPPAALEGALVFHLPKGAIAKVGKEDVTAKIGEDGKLPLTGVAGQQFIVSVWQGKEVLLTQKVFMLDDGSMMPPEIDPAKGEVAVKAPVVATTSKLPRPPTTATTAATTKTTAPPPATTKTKPAPVETTFE